LFVVCPIFYAQHPPEKIQENSLMGLSGLVFVHLKNNGFLQLQDHKVLETKVEFIPQLISKSISEQSALVHYMVIQLKFISSNPAF